MSFKIAAIQMKNTADWLPQRIKIKDDRTAVVEQENLHILPASQKL